MKKCRVPQIHFWPWKLWRYQLTIYVIVYTWRWETSVRISWSNKTLTSLLCKISFTSINVTSINFTNTPSLTVSIFYQTELSILPGRVWRWFGHGQPPFLGADRSMCRLWFRCTERRERRSRNPAWRWWLEPLFLVTREKMRKILKKEARNAKTGVLLQLKVQNKDHRNLCTLKLTGFFVSNG